MPKVSQNVQVNKVVFKDHDILDAETGEVLVTVENIPWQTLRNETIATLNLPPNRGETFLVRWEGDHRKSPSDLVMGGFQGVSFGRRFVYADREQSQIGLYANLSTNGQCIGLARIWEVQAPPSS